jgi:hypothetical protein
LHEFSLDNFDFNTLTIVDSDQLSIKPGYSKFLSAYMSPGIGMFSSKPERVDINNKTNLVASQAFREYDLWKPLINSFEKGEEKFVHWTFWPSTVFMSDAARDLVKYLKKMQRCNTLCSILNMGKRRSDITYTGTITWL